MDVLYVLCVSFLRNSRNNKGNKTNPFRDAVNAIAEKIPPDRTICAIRTQAVHAVHCQESPTGNNGVSHSLKHACRGIVQTMGIWQRPAMIIYKAPARKASALSATNKRIKGLANPIKRMLANKPTPQPTKVPIRKPPRTLSLSGLRVLCVKLLSRERPIIDNQPTDSICTPTPYAAKGPAFIFSHQPDNSAETMAKRSTARQPQVSTGNFSHRRNAYAKNVLCTELIPPGAVQKQKRNYTLCHNRCNCSPATPQPARKIRIGSNTILVTKPMEFSINGVRLLPAPVKSP